MDHRAHSPRSKRAPQLRALTVPLCALAAVLSLGSCKGYPRKTEGALDDFHRGRFEQALDAYDDEDLTGSEFLSGAEAGMAAMVAGDWARAQVLFGRAATFVEDVEDEALLSAEGLGETLLQWTVSESAQDYKGEGYERVMLHGCRAIAYLAEGRLEAARVELRLADELLTSEEELYEKKYEAGGLGHLLSAISYELQGSLDEAYIDYRRMQKKGVGVDLAGKALVRLGRALHYSELDGWIELYGEEEVLPAGAASIVLIAGVGLGPYKQPITIPIPTHDGILQWSVPEFVVRPQSVGSLVLDVSGSESTLRTVVVEDVSAIAKENLSDRILWLAGRSALRAFLKRELTKHLEDKWDFFGRLVGDLFTILSERADLRAWQTLPDSWQACRAFLAPGIHEISVGAEGSQLTVLGTFELEPGETFFIFARTLGNRVYAHAVGGRSIGEGELEIQKPEGALNPEAPAAYTQLGVE